MMEFSPCGQYLFTRDGLALLSLSLPQAQLTPPSLVLDNTPTALWIWDLATQKQAGLIVQKQPIKSAKWQPNTIEGAPVLIYCTASKTLFTWSPKGCGCIELPLGVCALPRFLFYFGS